MVFQVLPLCLKRQIANENSLSSHIFPVSVPHFNFPTHFPLVLLLAVAVVTGATFGASLLKTTRRALKRSVLVSAEASTPVALASLVATTALLTRNLSVVSLRVPGASLEVRALAVTHRLIFADQLVEGFVNLVVHSFAFRNHFSFF